MQSIAMQYHHPGCGDVYDSRILQPPSELPARSHNNSLSPYYLLNNGKKVHVPWCAIARDQPAVEVEDGARLNARTCTHRHVVVLRALNTDGEWVHGWFAKRQSNLLERLTKRIVIQIGVVCSSERPDSSLLRLYPDAWYSRDSMDFETLAVIRFERKHTLLTEVALRAREETTKEKCKPSRRPTRNSTRTTAKRPREETCTVCMEESIEFSPKRCGCKTPVCDKCMGSMRGLCPVCDRGVLNAHFECHCCNSVDDMSNSGFPCITCGQGVLCYACYRGFEECFACDCIS